jgi:hypothetical protein
MTSPTQPRYSFTRVFSAVKVGLGLALIVAAVRAVTFFLPTRINENDFSMAYLSGRVLADGGNPYRTDLVEYSHRLGLKFSDGTCPATNPPFLTWSWHWLAKLPVADAFAVIIALQAVSLIVVLWMTWWLLNDRLLPSAWCLAAGLTCCSLPVLDHFWFSQVQLPLLALLMTGFCLWRRSRPDLASAVLTLAGVLKLYPLAAAVWPFLAERGKRRWLAAVAGFAIVGVTLLLTGFDEWLWFVRIPLLGCLVGVSDGRYVSFTVSTLVGTGLSVLNHGSTSHLPPLAASVLRSGASIAMLVFTWWQVWRLRPTDSADRVYAAWSLVLLDCVLCSQVAWVHYLVFLIFPLALLAAQVRQALGARRVWLIGLLLFCLVAANVAGVAWYGDVPGGLRRLLNQLPTFAMILLYIEFARQTLRPREHIGFDNPT